jgi:hypothetical protein
MGETSKMANQIQIKRSATAATPVSLANGELAFTSNGNVLYIGSPNGSIVPIGGARFPGVLTANQALVANTTSGIDKVIVANLVPTSIWANGAAGTLGQVLTSNSSGGVYWSTPSASVSGSNTQVQFNDSGSLAGDADFTFDNTTNKLSVANAAVTSTTVSSNTTTGALTVAGGLGVNGRINVTDIAIGNASVYASVNNTVMSTNNLFATGAVNGSVLSVGSSVIANSSGLFTTGTVNGDILSVGTSFKANTTQVVIGSGVGLSANGSLGTAGQVLHSNGTSVYWDTDDGSVTSVSTGNGLTGGPITSTGTISVQANDGIVANTSGLFVKAGTGVTVNSTGVHIGQDVATSANVTFGTLSVTGNAALGDSGSDRVSINGAVNTSIMPSANVTYNLGNNTMRWAEVHTQNVHSITGKFDGNVEIAGNLTVTGGVSNVSVVDLVVGDPLIHIGANNETSDIVDLGWVGHYSDDGGSTKRHAGLFRDATDGEFKLFINLVQADLDTANAITVNTAAASYAIATLQAYVDSGALQTNSTAVSITANSTVNVAITANTLSLTTALAGTSGGTGRTTSTNNALLVGNSTNGYNELTLGTSGYVLQSNGTALVYDVLDGGSF